MSEPMLVLGCAPDTPIVTVFANEVYSLYHWLVREGIQPSKTLNDEVGNWAGTAASARHVRGVHGIWDEWELPLASGGTVEEAVAGLRLAQSATVEALDSALHGARSYFHRHVWKSHLETIEAAVATVRERMQPHFSALMARQGELLELQWPEQISAYLVADCYAWQGGYSHPLTIDVSANTGATLCETLIHEATHVADVSAEEHPTMGRRLMGHLTSAGISPQDTWNAWHGVIFASSADQVRRFIEPTHVDYASSRDLYSRLKVPHLSKMWSKYSDGAIAENELFESLAAQIKSH